MAILKQRSVNRQTLLQQFGIFQSDRQTDSKLNFLNEVHENLHPFFSGGENLHQYQSESRMKGDASE